MDRGPSNEWPEFTRGERRLLGRGGPWGAHQGKTVRGLQAELEVWAARPAPQGPPVRGSARAPGDSGSFQLQGHLPPGHVGTGTQRRTPAGVSRAGEELPGGLGLQARRRPESETRGHRLGVSAAA